MPSTTKTIKPAGGGDYTTLALALAGVAALMGDIILDCFAGDIGTGPSGNLLQVNTSWDTLLIRANATARHNGVFLSDTSAVARVGDGATSKAITIGRPGVTIDGLLICGRTNLTSNQTSSTFTNLLVQPSDSFFCGITLNNTSPDTSETLTLDNCVFLASPNGSKQAVLRVNGGAFAVNTTNSINATNCSGVCSIQLYPGGNSNDGFTANAVFNGANCAFFSLDGVTPTFSSDSNVAGDPYSVSVVNLSYCTIDGINTFQTDTLVFVTSATNTNGQIATAAGEFTDPAGGNLLLKSGAVSIGNGTAVGSATDVQGVARPASGINIGAFQTTPVAPAMPSARRASTSCGE